MILIPQFVVDWSQLPLGTYNPFADHPGSPGYWLLYCYQCLALTVSCVTNIGFDSLSSSLFIFIKCQLDLLAVRLDKMGRWNSAGGSVEQQLKQNIRVQCSISSGCQWLPWESRVAGKTVLQMPLSRINPQLRSIKNSNKLLCNL